MSALRAGMCLLGSWIPRCLALCVQQIFTKWITKETWKGSDIASLCIFPFSHSSLMVPIWRRHDDPYFSIRNLIHGVVKGTNSRIKIWSQDCVSKVKVNTLYLPWFFILFSSNFSPNSAWLCYNKKIYWLWQLWILIDEFFWWFSEETSLRPKTSL